AHFTAAVADLAGGRVTAGGAALARARGADHRGVDGQLPGRAEHAFRQIKIHPDGRVAAAPRPAARTASGLAATEEGVHDVAEREPGRPEAARAAGRRERITAEVIHLALFRVREDLVGLRDLLEPLLGGGIRVDVGVQLTRKAPVCLFDLVGIRVPAHTE